MNRSIVWTISKLRYLFFSHLSTFWREGTPRPSPMHFSTYSIGVEWTVLWTSFTVLGKALSGWFLIPWKKATCSTLIPAARSVPTESSCPASMTSPSTPRRSCPSSSSSPLASAPLRRSWHYWPTPTPRPCQRLANVCLTFSWWSPSSSWTRLTVTYPHHSSICCRRFDDISKIFCAWKKK